MSQETKNTRAYKNQKKNFSKEKKEQRKIRLVCIFPEKTGDVEVLKSDIKSILNMELRHQIQKQD